MKKISFLLFGLFITRILSAQVGINTETPNATLDVNGTMILRETSSENTDGFKPLYINPAGMVITIPEKKATSPIFSVQTIRDLILPTAQSKTSFNKGELMYLKLQDSPTQDPSERKSDILVNNLNFSIDSDGYIKVGQSGIYQINTLLNFIFAVSKAGQNIFVNIRLERSIDNGENWVDIVGFRPVYSISWAIGQNTPALLPSAITTLDHGDLIRCSFNRTKASGELQGDDVTGIQVQSGYSTPSFSIFFTKL